MNNLLNKKYTKLLLSAVILFQLNCLEKTVLADEHEKNTVRYYFTEIKETPNKIVETVSADSLKNCYKNGFIASNVLGILTDGKNSNYEAIGFGISRDNLYCIMIDSKGKRFYGYRELTNKDKKTLIEFLKCASGK